MSEQMLATMDKPPANAAMSSSVILAKGLIITETITAKTVRIVRTQDITKKAVITVPIGDPHE